MRNFNIDFIPFEERTEYYLKDLIADVDTEDYTSQYKTILTVRNNVLEWEVPEEKIVNILSDEITLDLWKTILAKNWDEIVAFDDEYIETGNFTKEQYNRIFGKFYRLFEAKLVRTYPKYSVIINLYKNNETTLLNKLKTSITASSESSGNNSSSNTGTTSNITTDVHKSRDNEVPQTSNVDPYDTSFTNKSNTSDTTNTVKGNSSNTQTGTSAATATTTTTTEQDPTTIMSRLEEIRDKWDNIIEEWSREFDSLFISR